LHQGAGHGGIDRVAAPLEGQGTGFDGFWLGGANHAFGHYRLQSRKVIFWVTISLADIF
jgi:hypothetical protein